MSVGRSAVSSYRAWWCGVGWGGEKGTGWLKIMKIVEGKSREVYSGKRHEPERMTNVDGIQEELDVLS